MNINESFNTALNIDAIKAVSLFASTDKTRPILQSVLVIDKYTYMATDSYALAIWSPCETAAELVNKVRGLKVQDDGALIPVDALNEMTKSLKKDSTLDLSVQDRDFRLIRENGSSHNGTVVDGSFPRVSDLLVPDRHDAVQAAFGVNQLERIGKAGRMLQRDGSMHGIVYHGGGTSLQPVYFTLQGVLGMLLVLQMPFRDDAGLVWGTVVENVQETRETVDA